MPNPSQVSSQNVNSELGVSTTTQLSWGNNWVRNVATQYSGTNSTVNASKMRWVHFTNFNSLTFPWPRFVSSNQLSTTLWFFLDQDRILIILFT